MENNYNSGSKASYYINLIARRIQTFFISTPEVAYLATLGIVIIILAILVSLFLKVK